MKWSPRNTLSAGMALIALTNAVALGGAAYNRGGEPESTLNLTERELRLPYVWAGRKENSGLALQLQWRVLHVESRDSEYFPPSSYGGGLPAWLDTSKMASLGFDVNLPVDDADGHWESPYYRQPPRDVLLVLELDGPAYREALDRAAKAAGKLEAKNERGTGKQVAAELMARESLRSSRLFAVDAGLDRAALRSKFTDRTKFAIVHGQVRPILHPDTRMPVGSIQDLSAVGINVPLELRDAFDGVGPDSYDEPNGKGKPFDVKLAFGQRLEPWLVSAKSRSNDK